MGQHYHGRFVQGAADIWGRCLQQITLQQGTGAVVQQLGMRCLKSIVWSGNHTIMSYAC